MFLLSTAVTLYVHEFCLAGYHTLRAQIMIKTSETTSSSKALITKLKNTFLGSCFSLLRVNDCEGRVAALNVIP